MKKGFLRRTLGIMLAGILMLESVIPVSATETVNDKEIRETYVRDDNVSGSESISETQEQGKTENSEPDMPETSETSAESSPTAPQESESDGMKEEENSGSKTEESEEKPESKTEESEEKPESKTEESEEKPESKTEESEEKPESKTEESEENPETESTEVKPTEEMPDENESSEKEEQESVSLDLSEESITIDRILDKSPKELTATVKSSKLPDVGAVRFISSDESVVKVEIIEEEIPDTKDTDTEIKAEDEKKPESRTKEETGKTEEEKEPESKTEEETGKTEEEKEPESKTEEETGKTEEEKEPESKTEEETGKTEEEKEPETEIRQLEVKAKLIPVSSGEADITVSVRGVKKTCHVYITASATGIGFESSEIRDGVLYLNDLADTQEIRVILEPSDTTDGNYTFEVSDADIIDCEKTEAGNLKISSKGSIGEASVTVKAGSVTSVLKINVVEDKNEHETEVKVPVNDIKLEAKLGSEDDEVRNAINLLLGASDATLSTASIGLKLYPANTTDRNFVWTSSDTSIVDIAVNDNAVQEKNSDYLYIKNAASVIAKSVGNATVTVTASNGRSAVVNVSVRAANNQSFGIVKKKVVLYCNENLPDINGVASSYTIDPVGMQKYDYCSSNTDIATVENVDGKGVVKALKPGQAVITVTSRDNGKKKYVTVLVRNFAEEIKLPSEKLTIIEGTTVEVPFTIMPEDISEECLATLEVVRNKYSPVEIVDYTRNSNKGVIKIKAKTPEISTENDATVTVSVGDNISYDVDGESQTDRPRIERKISIDVVPQGSITKAASVKITGNAKMKSGDSQNLSLTIKDVSGNPLVTGSRVIAYTSSDEEIATVSPDGRVDALKGGKVTITASILDGSGRSAKININIEQRPEKITFGRELIGINKTAKRAASITIKPDFEPQTVSKNCKGVTWEIIDAGDQSGKLDSSLVKSYFTIKNGRVNVSKDADDGMYAVVKCTSNEQKQVYGTVKVLVQTKKIASVKFSKTSNQVVGLGNHDIEFISKYVKNAAGVADFCAYSSDDEILSVQEVRDGTVTVKALKYGSAKITVCADNNLTSVTTVSVYPVNKGKITAKAENYYLQTYKNSPNDKVKLEFVNSSTNEKIDPALFNFISSKPSLVYVDDNGIAYANPASVENITNNNNEITITAQLKDDPDKRQATAKITLCTASQIERMDVKFYSDENTAKNDTNNEKGIYVSDNDDNASVLFGGNKRNIVLRVIPYNAKSQISADTDLDVTVSDPEVAEVSKTRRTVNSDNSKQNVWELTVSIKKAGKFTVDIQAKDEKGFRRRVLISSKSGKPLLASANIGTINKASAITDFTDSNDRIRKVIRTTKPFRLYPASGTKIKNIYINRITYSDADGNTRYQNLNLFGIDMSGSSESNEYSLVVLARNDAGVNQLTKVADGNYNIEMTVERTAMPSEQTGLNSGHIKETIVSGFTVISDMPKLSNINASLNPFIKGEEALLPFNEPDKITSIRFEQGQAMGLYFDIKQAEDKKWYVRIKDEKFYSYNESAYSGRLEVRLEGYETPVRINLNLKTKAVKPVVRQSVVPSVQLRYGNSADITLIGADKKPLTGITVERKNSDKAPVFNVEAQNDGSVKAVFAGSDMKLKSQGAKYSEVVLVKKPEWKEGIQLTLSVKAYNNTAAPTVKFAKSSVCINKSISENSAVAGVVSSQANVPFTVGNWTIPDKYTYSVKENGKSVKRKCSELFDVSYSDGELTVKLKDAAKTPAGNYRIALTDVWPDECDAVLKNPLTTSVLSVQVKNNAPKVTATVKGKLDLVNYNSYITCEVKVADVGGSVRYVKLGKGLEGFKYKKIDSNTIQIMSRSNSKLKAGKISGVIGIVMDNGSVIDKMISFNTVQGVPKVNIPEMGRIFKSASTQTADIDFNECVPEGVKISRLSVSDLPSGFNVQDNNGHLYVTLGNKGLRAGEYAFNVNVYFNGAQAVKESVYGKPVVITMYVKVYN